MTLLNRGTACLLATTLLLASCSAGAADQDLTLHDFVLGGGFVNAEEAAALEAQAARESQELTADCMAQHGFEYVPYVPATGDPMTDLGMSEEQFAAEFGFGLAAGIRDGGAPFALTNPNESADSNAEIVQSMDAAERAEYHRALYGPETELDSKTGMPLDLHEAIVKADPTACLVKSREAVASTTFWNEFGPEWTETVDRALADPRIIDARREWTACMAADGYRFADQQAVQSYLLSRLDEVVSYPDGEASDYLFRPPGQSGVEPSYDVGALNALIEEETAIAMLSLECSETHERVFAEVLAEYENSFIEENFDRLQEFRIED